MLGAPGALTVLTSGPLTRHSIVQNLATSWAPDPSAPADCMAPDSIFGTTHWFVGLLGLGLERNWNLVLSASY